MSPPFYFCPEFSLPWSLTYTSCLSNDHSASYYTNHTNKLSHSVQIPHIMFSYLHVYIYLCMQAMTPVLRQSTMYGSGSLLPLMGSWNLPSWLQAWWQQVPLTSEPCILATNCLCFIWVSLAFSTFFYSALLNDNIIPTWKLWCLVLFFKPE